MLVRLEQAVIGAGYIEFRAALYTLVAAQQRGTFPIQFFPLCRSEKLLVCFGGRCSGVSVSSVQMPCRSGSPHCVVNAAADAVRGGAGA